MRGLRAACSHAVARVLRDPAWPSTGTARARRAERDLLLAEVARLTEAHTTTTRILGAIEEYVYSGEFLADGSYVLRFAGPCRERFLGLPPGAAERAVWVDHVHPDELDLFDAAHEAARTTGTLDVQYRLLGADGRMRWVRDRGRMRRVGDRLFLDGSVLDVTTLRETEQRLTEHVRDIEVLASAHRELALTSDPAAARRAVCRAVRIVCGASGVALYEPEDAALRRVETDGKVHPESALQAGETSGTAGAYRAGTRRFVPDLGTEGELLASASSEAASVLFEPVLSGGQTVGVVTVVWDEPIPALSPRVEALLPLLVTEVAVALERADLVDRLSVAARTDPLTGLPNRRALDGLLPEQLAEAAVAGSSLWVAVVDLDHFKAYNDGFGHPAGDALLRDAAQRWPQVLRASDTLVRLGGEEFLVLMPGCRLSDAWRLLNRLRRSTPLGQTCSIGLAGWDGTETGVELIGRADKAMYAAKNSGRDRVLVAEDPATELEPVDGVTRSARLEGAQVGA
jgi:diguanylate cyclase (GGDEF)-like protein